MVYLKGDDENENKRLNQDATNVFILKIETNTWYTVAWPSKGLETFYIAI